MLYATHLVSMLHPEPAWIDPSGVLKYTSSTYAIIFFCQIFETAGFNIQNIGSRGLEVYFCFLMAMSHIGLQSWRVTQLRPPGGSKLNDGLFSETMDFRDFPSVLSAVRIAQS